MFDGFYVIEVLLLEFVFYIDEFFVEFIGFLVFFVIGVDFVLDVFDLFVWCIGLVLVVF